MQVLKILEVYYVEKHTYVEKHMSFMEKNFGKYLVIRGYYVFFFKIKLSYLFLYLKKNTEKLTTHIRINGSSTLDIINSSSQTLSTL